MARSLWSGSLSFGLVNVPVQLLTAVRDLDLHFRQLHDKDGAPIETQRWCSQEEVEVPYDEIAHSYELESGEQVIVTDEELESIEPRRTRTIEIEQFVDLADVDPIYFDHPYFLVPASSDDGAARAYRLLTEVMGRTERAALGRLVMRTKEYLAIVRARDGVLALTTMLFADEVRATKDVETGSGRAHKPAKRQVEAAVAVIEELSTEWDPAAHRDRYRARLRRVVERKRKGETVKAPAQKPAPETAPDLMAALEQTLEEMRSGSKSKSPAREQSQGKGSHSKKPRERQEA